MKKLRITVGKKTYDVTVEVVSDDSPAANRPATVAPAAVGSASAPPPSSPTAAAPGPAGPGAVVSPMAGTVKSIAVKVGDTVEAGDVVAVLEAMKMENKISAPKAGKVTAVKVDEGQSVTDGQELVTLE